MKTHVISQQNPFDGYFPEERTERQKSRYSNIQFRVCVSQIPPRDDQFEHQLDMGRLLIPTILEHKKFTNNGSLFFCFPERWMSQKEQYHFIELLVHHPSVAKAEMTVVDMFTISPVILTHLENDDLRLITLKKHVDGLSPAIDKALSKIKRDDE